MNAYMNIQVRVLSEQAMLELKALRGQIAQYQAQLVAADKTAAASALGGTGTTRSISNLRKWGSQLQWTGRQIQYNFTVPILLAAGAATKFALDNQRAMTQVRKVYGDQTAAVQYLLKVHKDWNREQANTKASQTQRQELQALGRAFEAISNHYAVNRAEVMETAAAWAAAGVSGVALARSVDLTMKAVIIGNLDAAKATQSLIAIQAQYNLNSKQLASTLAELNAIENQTGIDTGGLIEGFARSASVAREAGVDVRHLGAMLAALVPATGSASQAGNAIKTIISRLLAPTQDAVDILGELSINIQDAGWQSLTATERLELLSRKWQDLTHNQRADAAAVLASRYQITKFSQLMQELGPEFSYYEKALDATNSRQKSFRIATQELNKVLDSNPQKLKQVWTVLQNGMADIVAPLIPYIIYLADVIKNLVLAFQGLNPAIQKFALFALIALALLGPFLKYLGSIATVLGVLGPAFRLAGRAMMFGFIRPLIFLGTVGVGILTAAFSGLTTIAGFGVKALIFIFSKLGVIVEILRFTGLLLVGVSADIWKAIGRVWAVGGRAVITFMAFWGRTIAAVTGAGMFATQYIISNIMGKIITFLMGALTLIETLFVSTFRTIPIIASRMWTALYLIYTTGATVLRGIVALLGAGLTALWAAISAGITAIWTALQTVMAFISIRGGQLIAGAMTVVGTVLTKLWAAISAAMVVVWNVALETMLFTLGVFVRLAPVIMAGLAAIGPIILAVLTSPWTYAVLAVAGVIYAFRDDILTVFENIKENGSQIFAGLIETLVNLWNLLPDGVANALSAVVQIVAAAAQQVYEWLSYLNPFAHHSPSLVEDVKSGVAAIQGEYAKLGSLGGSLRQAQRDVEAYGDAIASLENGARTLEQAQNRKKIAKFDPSAVDEYDRLIADLARLQPLLDRVTESLARQQAVVDSWQSKVDAANYKLDQQTKILEHLQDVANGYQDQLNAAQQALQDYASAPLKGMQAMEDRIFRNEMAQKRLRLEMMKMENAVGTLDEIKQKMTDISGAQELLRGQQASLRSAGAGSEILGVYDKEISKLDKQKDKYQETADKLQQMQDRLDDLQRAAEKLDLIKALKFDALQRRIEKAANTIKEMSFDQIMRGIRESKNDIAKYTDKLEEANKKVARQQAIVDALTKKRDVLQNHLDIENRKLQKIQDRYDKINDTVQAINQALNDSVSAVSALTGAKGGAGAGAGADVSQAIKNFRAAGKGTFADVSGAGVPIRTNWTNQSSLIDKFTKDLEQSTSDMFAGINPFSGWGVYWDRFTGWFAPKWQSFWSGLSKSSGLAFSGSDFGGTFQKLLRDLQPTFDAIAKGWNFFVKGLKLTWDLLGPEVIATVKQTFKGIMRIWEQISPELKKLGQTLKPAVRALGNVLAVFLPIALGIIKAVWSAINGVIFPALEAIGGILAGVIQVINGSLQIIAGTINFVVDVIAGVVDLFQGDWQDAADHFGAAGKDIILILKGIWNMFKGTFDAIWSIVKGVVKIIWGAISGLVKGIWGFFKWLFDVLVGHSIIPDMVNAIIDLFELLTAPIKAVFDGIAYVIKATAKAIVKVLHGLVWFFHHSFGPVFSWLWQKIIKPIFGWIVDKIKKAWQLIKPGLEAEIKFIKDKLGPIFEWLWQKVIKPVFGWIVEKVKAAWKLIKPIFDTVVSFIKNTLGPVFQWLWQNIIKPIWDNITSKIGSAWSDKIQPVLQKVHDFIHNVVAPAFKFLKKVAGEAFNGVANVARVPINWVIEHVYQDGLKSLFDKIATAVGLSWSLPDIEPIPPFARGGPVYGAGTGTSDSITAKLSRGEHVWTAEEVRNAGGHMAVARLRSVYAGGSVQALRAVQLGLGGDPVLGFDLGGAWDWVKDRAGDVKDQASATKNWIVNKSLDWVAGRAKDTINSVMDLLPQSGLEDIGRAASMTIMDKTLHMAAETVGLDWSSPMSEGGAGIQRALAWARTQDYAGYMMGAVGPGVYDCSGFMSAITNIIRGNPPHHRVGSTADFPWTGFSSGIGGFTIGSTPNYAGTGIGHMAGTLAGTNVESAGGVGVRIGSSARGWDDPGFVTHAYINGFLNGGLVRSKAGGVLARLGEGPYDEAVVPLPNDYRRDLLDTRRGRGGTTNNFYGDLSFPNVKDGSDAESFISNLETLARGL